jgi:hypothetical protein
MYNRNEHRVFNTGLLGVTSTPFIYFIASLTTRGRTSAIPLVAVVVVAGAVAIVPIAISVTSVIA